MTIHPSVTFASIRLGVAARATEIGLVCHGQDSGRALTSLRTAVGIWARALASDGTLEPTLARLGVAWDAQGQGIVVEPDVASVTA